jgi:hypothetical protein
MIDSLSSADELITLLSCPAADIVYHLDDIAEQISASGPEIWEDFSENWSEQDSAWKSTAEMIIDKLTETQKAILLRAVIECTYEEDARVAANLASQLGHSNIGGLVPSVVSHLERSWGEFPDLRDYISVCAKAGGLPIRVGP